MLSGNLTEEKSLTVQDKAVETLTGLGLTILQSKVYLELAKGGKATVKDIAKKSNIARQDLYRIAPQLLNLGLIEKLIDTPTKFRAIPIKEATEILIERRRKQTAQIEQESKQLLSYFTSKESDGLKDEESQFIIINDLQARLSKTRKQVVITKKIINIVTKWSFFLTYTPETIDELNEALKRGVHVHIITQAPRNTDVFPKKLQKLLKYPHFEVRYISSLPSSMVAVFDKEEVNILLSSDKTPAETAMLVSNNINLIELSQNYFDVMWASAVICCFS